MLELKNDVDGVFRDAESGALFDVVNPATGETIATAPDSTPRASTTTWS
jgi:acyl-CoA reductase-like NAD-dependent aldehyde dehydrogenase